MPDLASCTLLSTAAVDLLEETAVMLQAKGGRLTVVGATGLQLRVLQILGADYLLAIGT